MNEIVNKFLLAGDTFMPEMHLRQSGFTYSACGTSTKKKKKKKKKTTTTTTTTKEGKSLKKQVIQIYLSKRIR